MPFITTTSAAEAYEDVLNDSGAYIGLNGDGTFFERRDAVDERIINQVRTGTGHIINDPGEVGGYPPLDPGIAYADTDNDGMGDAWELIHFGSLSWEEPSGPSRDYDKDGYTDLEEFLWGLDPKVRDTVNPRD